jgi:hypothetical protein
MQLAIHIVRLLWGNDYQRRRKRKRRLTPRISEHGEFWRSGTGNDSQRDCFSRKPGIGRGDRFASKRVGTAVLGQQ